MPTAATKLERVGMTVKLGRIPATPEMRQKFLPLSKYIQREGGKPPPPKTNYREKCKKSLAEMHGNDQQGTCVIAAALHAIGVWSANEPGGKEVIASTSEALTQYRAICGAGDNGCHIPRVLDWFRDRGLTAGGANHKGGPYVYVEPRDDDLVRRAVHMFGGLHLGVNWPADWSNQAAPGVILRPTNSRVIGGHAIQVVDYDAEALWVSTWGFVCGLSWDAMGDPRFVDECFAALSPDWHNDEGLTASGLNVQLLREHLDVIAAGGTPEYPDEPPPAPPMPPPTPPVPPPHPPHPPTILNVRLTGKLPDLKAGEELVLTGTATNADVAAGEGAPVLELLDRMTKAAKGRDWAALLEILLAILAAIGPFLTPRQLAFFTGELSGFAKEITAPKCGNGVDKSTPDV